MPPIGPLHHPKPGIEAGRLVCSEQRSICLSVSTTHASLAGEVQRNVSAFVAGDLCILEVRNPTRSATFSAYSVCFGLERPVAASVFDVVGAYVTVP